MRELLNVDGEGTCIHERSAIGRAHGTTWNTSWSSGLRSAKPKRLQTECPAIVKLFVRYKQAADGLMMKFSLQTPKWTRSERRPVFSHRK
jgi:hypothetical protein